MDAQSAVTVARDRKGPGVRRLEPQAAPRRSLAVRERQAKRIGNIHRFTADVRMGPNAFGFRCAS